MQFFTLTILSIGAALVHGSKLANNSWVPYFDNLVAFGDSYTDENRLGYFINHNGAAPPVGTLLPQSTSASSGGMIWARFVSVDSGAKLWNYAVSGAVCDNKIIYRDFSAIHGPFPDVVYEVDAFVADSKYVDPNTKEQFFTARNDNTVYSMWIGTNDIGAGAFLTDSNAPNTTISDYIDCMFTKFDQLYKNGGRYFVLMNLAPLQLSPLYGLPDKGGLPASHYWPDKPSNITASSYKIKEYITTVNTLFDSRVPFELLIAKRYPGASFAIFDVYQLMTDIYNDPTKYLAAPANVTHPYQLCEVIDSSKCVTSSNSLESFFWNDELHPAPSVDKAIAAEFVKVAGGSSSYATYWR